MLILEIHGFNLKCKVLEKMIQLHKPEWIRVRCPDPRKSIELDKDLICNRVHTVCRSARCPNIGECFSKGHLTFMIMGDVCTRACRFCAVKKGVPTLLDYDEPYRMVEVIRKWVLNDIVITSVTRDDLPDGGAGFYAYTIRVIRDLIPDVKIEILTPDFKGNRENLGELFIYKPDIWAHNVETVPRLYPLVRSKAEYKRSLELLAYIKKKDDDILTKSGIMLGLGETEEEIREVLKDLCSVGVDIVTLGQYLQPTRESVEVTRYLLPKEFEYYKRVAYQMGFKKVVSGPLVRSSYKDR